MPIVALALLLYSLLNLSATLAAEPLVDTITRVKPSIVGVGTYAALRRPPAILLGTGFVVDNGHLAATNYHVIDIEANDAQEGDLVVFVGHGRQVEYRSAEVVAMDSTHDLALLRFSGDSLPTLTLAGGRAVPEGTAIAFTGFPIGAVLGLHPVTHRGIVSAITPIAIPASSTRELSAQRISALRDPFKVLQLDATAYPGNSGSPVYRVDTGVVVGVINQVLVKGTKENALKDPSAITYAIPVEHLNELLSPPR
ncbi:MAG: serine protease [Gammaproteobacteria bacterium]